jgi:DNA-binding response OmpR family regulator
MVMQASDSKGRDKKKYKNKPEGKPEGRIEGRHKEVQEDPQKTILIVDDDVALAEVYRARLEVEGYKVVIQYDGEEALRWLSGSTADLIIMDCWLPKFGGLSVLETLNEGKPKSYKTPVVMVSGLDRPEYKNKAEELGAVQYLVKSSASISDMVDAVEDGLRIGSGQKKVKSVAHSAKVATA